MNELSLRQRLSDGTDPTVMSLQRQGEEREHYETSIHLSLSLSLFLVPTPRFSCPVMGSYYMLVTHSRPCPLQTIPLLSSPGPGLPCPALPVPAQQTLAPAAKIPISHPRSGTQAKTAANLVCVCVFIRVSV